MKSLSETVFRHHVETDHHMSAFSEYLKEIVYGANDGIVTTFAVVAGFAGANSGDYLGLGVGAILLFGLANLFADGSSMGLGNFLSVRADQDLFRRHQAKELYEIRHNPDFEKLETKYLLIKKGFSSVQAEQVAELYATNENYWLDFMMHQELEMQNPSQERPGINALATFFAFLIFGLIPLLPYLLVNGMSAAFIGSAIATAAALVLLGVLRWVATRNGFLRSVLEIVFIGGTSAVIAYIVGTFFRV